MLWIKSWIENPSKSEVIGRCGGDEKTNDHAEPTKVERYFFKIQIILFVLIHMLYYIIQNAKRAVDIIMVYIYLSLGTSACGF